jgi:hypothetical protein
MSNCLDHFNNKVYKGKASLSTSWRQTGGSTSVPPLILNLGTRWRSVVNFTPRPYCVRERTPVPQSGRLGWVPKQARTSCIRVCVCVCVRVRACVRACVCVCVHRFCGLHQSVSNIQIKASVQYCFLTGKLLHIYFPHNLYITDVKPLVLFTCEIRHRIGLRCADYVERDTCRLITTKRKQIL